MSDGSAKETGLAVPTGLEQATSRLIDPLEAPNARNEGPIKIWPNAAYFQPNPNRLLFYAAWLFQDPKEGEFRFITAPVTLSDNPDNDKEVLEDVASQGLDPKKVAASSTEEKVKIALGTPRYAGPFQDIRRMIKEGFATEGFTDWSYQNEPGWNPHARSSSWDPVTEELRLVGHPYIDKDGTKKSPFFTGKATPGLRHGQKGLFSLSEPIDPSTTDPKERDVIGKVLKANLAKK